MRTRVPIVAVAVVTAIPCLLTLIYIGSSTAYTDVISLSVSGLYGSYLIPCACLLWRRSTGQVLPHAGPHDGQGTAAASAPHPRLSQHANVESYAGASGDESDAVSDALIDPPLEWGPWRVPGALGIVNNAFACTYCVFVLFWDFWPPQTPATAESMNYSVLVFGFVILFALFYYYAWGRRHYRGPLIDYEVKAITNSFVVARKRSKVSSRP